MKNTFARFIFPLFLIAGAIYFASIGDLGFCIIWTAFWHAWTTEIEPNL